MSFDLFSVVCDIGKGATLYSGRAQVDLADQDAATHRTIDRSSLPELASAGGTDDPCRHSGWPFRRTVACPANPGRVAMPRNSPIVRDVFADPRHRGRISLCIRQSDRSGTTMSPGRIVKI
ncbi:MAG: hypothetical protein NZ734_14090 [Paracoccus sp.]|nr:hypothetical protein [Paracoccus sp. (in: a-proteobacteria)]